MTRTIEQSLNLVPVTKPKTTNPTTQRRNRLLKAIRRQKLMLDKYKAGEKTSRVWFWTSEDGSIYLQIKYGKHVIELGKGKFAILCESIEDIAINLDKVESLTLKGELDNILAEISSQIKAKFEQRKQS